MAQRKDIYDFCSLLHSADSSQRWESMISLFISLVHLDQIQVEKLADSVDIVTRHLQSLDGRVVEQVVDLTEYQSEIVDLLKFSRAVINFVLITKLEDISSYLKIFQNYAEEITVYEVRYNQTATHTSLLKIIDNHFPQDKCISIFALKALELFDAYKSAAGNYSNYGELYAGFYKLIIYSQQELPRIAGRVNFDFLETLRKFIVPLITSVNMIEQVDVLIDSLWEFSQEIIRIKKDKIEIDCFLAYRIVSKGKFIELDINSLEKIYEIINSAIENIGGVSSIGPKLAEFFTLEVYYSYTTTLISLDDFILNLGGDKQTRIILNKIKKGILKIKIEHEIEGETGRIEKINEKTMVQVADLFLEMKNLLPKISEVDARKLLYLLLVDRAEKLKPKPKLSHAIWLIENGRELTDDNLIAIAKEGDIQLDLLMNLLISYFTNKLRYQSYGQTIFDAAEAIVNVSNYIRELTLQYPIVKNGKPITENIKMLTIALKKLPEENRKSFATSSWGFSRSEAIAEILITAYRVVFNVPSQINIVRLSTVVRDQWDKYIEEQKIPVMKRRQSIGTRYSKKVIPVRTSQRSKSTQDQEVKLKDILKRILGMEN